MTIKTHPDDIIRRLKAEAGDSFTVATVDAFTYLGLAVEKIQETQAESNIIAKAPRAQRPYFVIIECGAVREGEQVSYLKLGQIRGNSPKYVARYGGDFLSFYKVIVGRPTFSEDAKKLAPPDVALISADNLARLLKHHKQFYFSEDELEQIFAVPGEVTGQKVDSLIDPFLKKLRLYALIYMSLLFEPTSKPHERKRDWTSIQQLTGAVEKIGWFLNVRNITERDVVYAVRDIANPFLKLVEMANDDKVRLASIPLEVFVGRMQDRGKIFCKILMDFQKKALSQRSRAAKK